ncbi:unnamed protein product [Linum trigynum]|uniref:Uncharacterized protein n=1 Tax=Linum trigynum TaxID=586398 RepID=A0AAV2DZS7_9ROSI
MTQLTQQPPGLQNPVEAEEFANRPEKKRKLEHRINQSESTPMQNLANNLSVDSLSFTTGRDIRRYARKKHTIQRRSIREINEDGNQSGEGESNFPMATAAGHKPPS